MCNLYEHFVASERYHQAKWSGRRGHLRLRARRSRRRTENHKKANMPLLWQNGRRAPVHPTDKDAHVRPVLPPAVRQPERCHAQLFRLRLDVSHARAQNECAETAAGQHFYDRMYYMQRQL